MSRLLVTLILLIIMNSCDKTLATYSMIVEGKDLLITDLIYIMKVTDEWDDEYTRNRNLDKIGCFLLEEVLKHNPSVAEDMEKNDHAFAVIRNFTGTVTFTANEERYYRERLPILNIRGEGNINFHTDYDPESLLEGMDD